LANSFFNLLGGSWKWVSLVESQVQLQNIYSWLTQKPELPAFSILVNKGKNPRFTQAALASDSWNLIARRGH
jgi:hypothetical protein